MAERMTRREWFSTLLGAGLVVSLAAIVDAQSAISIVWLAVALFGAGFVTTMIMVVHRFFSRKPRSGSVRLQMEVHP